MKACKLAVLLFILAGILISPAFAVSYKRTVIEGLPGYAITEVTGINNRGQVVGYCRDNYGTTSEAFIWDAENGLRSLGGYPYASAINNNGEVIGQATLGFNGADLWRWDQDHGFTYLSEHGGAMDINDEGIITGFYRGACIWDKNNTFEYLADATYHQKGSCINNNGIIAGGFDRDNSPVVWTSHTEVTYLPQLWGVDQYTITGINDNDVIIGFTDNMPAYSKAIYWKKLPGGIFSVNKLENNGIAYDINNKDQIVGMFRTRSSGNAPCIWDYVDGNYVMTQLDGNGCPTAINDNGLIAGSSDMGLVLWQPVPEPGSMITLLLGLGGFAGIIRRRCR